MYLLVVACELLVTAALHGMLCLEGEGGRIMGAHTCAGNKGTAITFIAPEEDQYAPDLVKALTDSGAPIPQASSCLEAQA